MTTPTVEERITNLEGSFAQIATRLDRVEMNARFDQLQQETNSRFDQIQQQLNLIAQEHQAFRSEIITRLERLDRRYERLVYWILAMTGAMAAAILAALLT